MESESQHFREAEQRKVDLHLSLTIGSEDIDVDFTGEKIRDLANGSWGDISLLKGTMNGKDAYLVEKDYRGSEYGAEYAGTMHRVLARSNVPTLEFFGYQDGEDAKVYMSYVGTPDFSPEQPRTGDQLCVGPMQMSESVRYLLGKQHKIPNLDRLAERVRAVTDGLKNGIIRVPLDAYFVTLEFQDGAWSLCDILVGDFDHIQFDGEEDPTERNSSNNRNVIGVIGQCMSDVQQLPVDEIDRLMNALRDRIDGKEEAFTFGAPTKWEDL